MSHNNSFDILPDFSAATPPADQQPPQPPVNPPTVEEERNLLWRTIYNLATNVDTFTNRQTREFEDNRFAMQAIVQELSYMRGNNSSSSTTGSGAPRVREPRMFSGAANQVDPFVREITHALTLQRRSIVTDRDKCLYLGFYLSDGSPTSWYTSVEKHRPEIMEDYPAFLSAFKEHFEDSDRYATALAKLRKLKQAPGSASNYASRFRELSWELDLTDQSLIQTFYDGLKDNVKDAITFTTVNGAPTQFDEYVKMAITLDNKLHRRQVERQNTSFKTSNDKSSNSKSSSFLPSTPSSASAPAASSSNNDVVPMEIDGIKRGPLTDAEREHRRKEGLCFYCGKGKHSVAECPNMSETAKRKFKGKNKASPSGKA